MKRRKEGEKEKEEKWKEEGGNILRGILLNIVCLESGLTT